MLKLLSKIKSHFQDFIPKSILCFREGYTTEIVRNDLLAGITVGIIALPLALAFAIGSGVSPERGLFTAIVAGLLISMLGGSRVQIGGPTGAFVVIIFSIVQRHGYEGLAIATLIAGILLILMGLARFGVLLKFIPYSVTTGFTTGIAVVIFTSQIKDFFGLKMEHVSPEFLEKCVGYCRFAHTWSSWSALIAAAALAGIFLLRAYLPKWPGAIIAIIVATIATYYFELPLETIETKFGGIPRMLPVPSWPVISWGRIQEMFPDAITIALLGAIESLLSAVVADGMTGNRHRSNCELVAQGFANIGSIIFGGIPATGAIARTSANIRMGAKTPLAGMVHAVTLLLLMVFFAPLAAKIPLAALSAVLVYVAWNMSELPHFLSILKGPRSDALVLVVTFLLTVLIDLTVAVQVGVILSAFLFLKHMTDATKVCKILMDDNARETSSLHDGKILFRKDIPEDVVVFEISGPFFYSVSDQLDEVLRQLAVMPHVFILRMGHVPLVDISGIQAIKKFAEKCQQNHIQFFLCEVRPEVLKVFDKTGLKNLLGSDHIYAHLNQVLNANCFQRKKT